MANGLQVAGDGLVVLPRDEPQAVAHPMHDARLDARLRIYRVDGIRKAFQAVNAGDENVVQTAIFQLCEHVQPELCPFIFGQPHTQQFFLTFDIDAQRQEHGFVDDAVVLPHFHDDKINKNNGIYLIQWPILPFYNLLHDGIGNL